MALSLVSVNIERDKHFEQFLPFLVKQKPDVVCFQELFERDIPRIVESIGGSMEFAPMTIYADEEGAPIEGIGLWSRAPRHNSRVRQYAGGEGPIVEFHETFNLEEKYASIQHLLLVADIEHDGTLYRVATTHFPWTPDGNASDMQRTAADTLIALLAELGEYALCGDFNTPRGGEMFARFAARLTDHVPEKYTTSLDQSLHRAGNTPAWEHMAGYMVDVLFTTPGYAAQDVRLEFGVSDHAAIVATIEKTA